MLRRPDTFGSTSLAQPTLAVITTLALTFASGCGRPTLGLDEAAGLLSRSLASSESEHLQLATPSGCFLLARRDDIKNTDVERDPQIARLPYVLSTLRRERDLGLIEFEFSETPADAPVPPTGCGQLWAAQHAGAEPVATASRFKLVVWKATPSDKAIAAGLQPGQTFLYLRKTLIDIVRLIRKDNDTMIAEYRWRWAPSYEGEHLGIQPSTPMAGKARFKNNGDGWRLAP
jgi:hypothetical protein